MTVDRKVFISNESDNPLQQVDVEAYDPATGRVLQTARTGSDGVASFTGLPEDSVFAYRPRVTRRSGKYGDQALSGAAKVREIQGPGGDGTTEITKVSQEGVRIVFLSAPQQITPDTPSNLITIQRQTAITGSPLTVGNLMVHLYTTSPGGSFSANPVTIINGQSTATFRYTDDTSGNPVITASDIVLT